MAQGASRYAAYLAELASEFPRFAIIEKQASPFQRAIDLGLRVITLGAMRSYLTCYQTTIGQRIYVTPSWHTLDEDERYVILRHEAEHLRQFRRYSFVGMTLLYLFLPLPMGLAWWRAHFEKAAYAESIRAAAEVWGPHHPAQPHFRAHIISQFTCASYGWMWPFEKSLQHWYDEVLATLDAGRTPAVP